jgi:protoporphyrin/coproporphyrin ferrochelatase
MTQNRTAILLLAHGTPESVDEIPEYLRNVTAGRTIPDSVIAEIKHRYAVIGRSPLTEITMRQRDLLASSLKAPVYVGMRNWKPYIADALKQMQFDGIEHAVALCLAPQNSRTSVGLYRSAVEKEANGLKLEFVESWHDHPLLISAFADRLNAARARNGDAIVLFTAHSVPTRTIEAGDPYEKQARETASLVASKVGLSKAQWTFAFQSQGMSGGAWLRPTVEETLQSLAGAGHKRVLMQPIGFVCDHVEVLYDIDIAFREFGKQIGIEVSRTESLNESGKLIGALRDLVQGRMASVANNRAIG